MVNDSIPESVIHRILARADYTYFCTRYLKEFFWYPFNDRYHGNIFGLLHKIETHEVTRPTIVTGGRESGKSMYGNLVLPLHCLCYPQWIELPDGTLFDMSKKYILFVQANTSMATRPVARVMKQLMNNELLIEDFGNMYLDDNGRAPRTDRTWTRQMIQTSNGYTLEAKGRMSKYRGVGIDQHRIGLAVADDLEDDKSVKKKKRRDEDVDFITTTLLNAISNDYGNLLILGTILQSNSMISQLIDFGSSNDWNIRVFPVYEVDPETNEIIYLWPERFGPEWVASKLKDMPTSAFQQEFLQDPRAATTDLSLNDFEWYDMPDIQTLLDTKADVEVCMGIDPNCRVHEMSDYGAFVPTVLHKPTGIKYVLPPYAGHLKFHAKVDKAIGMYKQVDADLMVIETVQFQIALKEEIDRQAREKFLTVNTFERNQTKEKKLRISRTFGGIRAKTIRFLRGCSYTQTLVDQLINLYTADNDDLADAFEMSIGGHDHLQECRAAGRNKGAARAKVIDGK